MPIPPPANTGTDLVRIHKAFTRALVVILKNSQGAGPVPGLREGFRSYVLAFHNTLDTHHQGEDKIAFPFWEPKLPTGCIDRLLSQHTRMVPLLVKVQAWLESGDEAWEGSAMVNLHSATAALNSLWHSHAPLEEERIGPINAGALLTAEENAQLSAQLATFAQEHSFPHELVVPFMLYNLPVEERPELARVFPPVVVQYLAPIAWKATWAPMQPFLLV